MLGMNSPCEICRKHSQARPLSLIFFHSPSCNERYEYQINRHQKQLQEDRSSRWFSLPDTMFKLKQANSCLIKKMHSRPHSWVKDILKQSNLCVYLLSLWYYAFCTLNLHWQICLWVVSLLRNFQTVLCQSKLADRPYFTRLKGPTDSFPIRTSDKGKTVMGDNNDEVNLTDVVVAQHTVAEQNKLIMQIMQQVTEIRVEMLQRQDTPPPGFGPNIDDGRPPIYFPSSNTDQTQNQPSTPVHNPSVIDLTTQNPQYASVSYKTPSLLPNNHPQMLPYPQNTQTAHLYESKTKPKSNCLQSLNTSSPFKLEHQSSGLPTKLPDHP